MHTLPPTASPFDPRIASIGSSAAAVPPQNIWQVNGVVTDPAAPTNVVGAVLVQQVSGIPGVVTTWSGTFAKCASITFAPLAGFQLDVASDLSVNFGGALTVQSGVVNFTGKIITPWDTLVEVKPNATLDISRIKSKSPLAASFTRGAGATLRRRHLSTDFGGSVFADYGDGSSGSFLDATNNKAVEGGAVSSVIDYSGNTRHLAAAGATVQSGMLRLSGASKSASRARWNDVNKKFSSGPKWVMAITGTWTMSGTYARLWSANNDLAAGEWQRTGTLTVANNVNSPQVYISNAGGIIISPTSVIDGTKQIWLVVGLDGIIYLRRTGVALVNGALGTSTSDQNNIGVLTIGDDSQPSVSSANLLLSRAVMLQLPGALTGNGVERLEGLLAWDEGTPTMLPAAHAYQQTPPTVVIQDSGTTLV